jgi:hypothetical protein
MIGYCQPGKNCNRFIKMSELRLLAKISTVLILDLTIRWTLWATQIRPLPVFIEQIQAFEVMLYGR